MTRILRGIWSTLIWILLFSIPVQFYLAGHGAMEGAHAADKGIHVMKNAWDPHAFLGTLMVLLSLIILLVALAARPGRRLVGFTVALAVFMIIQLLLPNLNDSSSTRWIAALHGVNALVVTGLVIMLAMRSRTYLPFMRSEPATPEPAAQS